MTEDPRPPSLPAPVGARDRIAAFFAEKTARRLLMLGLFLAGVYLFRGLLILLVFFVVFERGFEALAAALQKLGMKRQASLGISIALFLILVTVGLGVGVSRLVRLTIELRDTLPERIAAIQEMPLYQKVREHVDDLDKVVEGARHYATNFLGYLSTVGHIALYALIGFILAVVFLLDRETMRTFNRRLDPSSLLGTQLRWVGHVADALFVTVQFQLVVAACNAFLTIPVLLLVGVKHVPSLGVLIFVSGLVPVVGNFVSGAILSILAYQASGWFGVGLFTVLTFVLHKAESYYINPRLAARHVRLPGFVLIVSLILWEHLLGFVGLFVSFPFLFVAQRIAHELERENVGLPPEDDSEPLGIEGKPHVATPSASAPPEPETGPTPIAAPAEKPMIETEPASEKTGSDPSPS